MTTTMCERCAGAIAGENGHDALEFYVGGPWPGHHIFRCTVCDERWIRHSGVSERYSWTRYSVQFPKRAPRAPMAGR
jgi:hypothetical protein